MNTSFKLGLNFVIPAVSCLLLGGCGLAETGAVAAAQGETAVQQAQDAKKKEEQIQKDLDAANQAAADARAKAEEAAGQ